MFRNRRIDAYVLRELAGPTLLALLLFTFLLMMNLFFLVAEKALSKGLSAELTMRLFVVGIPQLLVLSLPMAILLGTLLALGRLSADHEWVALQGAGRGPASLLRPVLIHGLIGALASFLIYTVVQPRTHYAFRNLRGQVLFSSNLAADLKPRVFYELPGDRVLFVDEISPDRQRRLEGVLMIEPNQDEITTNLIVARYGDIYPAGDGSGALVVDAYEGEARAYRSTEPDFYQMSRFDRGNRYRIEPSSFVKSLLTPPQKVVQDLSFGELWAEFAESSRERRAVRAQEGAEKSQGRIVVAERRYAVATVEFQQRLALPLASLLFAFLALPLGITNVRSGKGAGFAMSLVVILIYRAVFVLTRNQSLTGTIPPEIGPWIANAVILVWAVIAYRRLGRSQLRGQGRLAGLLSSAVGLLKTARAPRRSAAPARRAADGSEITTYGGTPRRFLGRIDRYVGAAYLRFLGFALAGSYVIFGLVELQSLMDGILDSQQPMSLIVDYFKFFAPTVLDVILPIVCLVAAMVAITVLSRKGELIAIKASGIGMRRTTVPILMVTVVLCVLLFVVEDRIAPSATRKAQAIRDQIEGHTPRTHGLPVNGRWTLGPDGRKLYHYRLYVPAKQDFRGLTVFTLDREGPRVIDHLYADHARWTGDEWDLRDGWYRSFSPERFELFEDSWQASLDDPEHLVGQENRLATGSLGDLPEQLSIAELAEQIDSLRNSGYDITSLRVAYHGKFSRAIAPLVMVLLGLPFAFQVGRRGSLYGIGVALLLVLIYWATFAIFNALGMESLLLPVVAAWAPNVMFGLVGFYMLLYVRT